MVPDQKGVRGKQAGRKACHRLEKRSIFKSTPEKIQGEKEVTLPDSPREILEALKHGS